MDAILCPECGASNPIEAHVCEECNADLSAVKSVIDTANSHYNEALALAHNGKLDEALGQIEASLALSSENPQFHNLMGTIYAQKGLYTEAMRAWERCMALDPEFEKAYKNMEKARRMEEEAVEEDEQRPYIMKMYIAYAAAALFLVVTLYFGFRLNSKNRMIDDYSVQLAAKDQAIDAQKDRLNKAEAEVNAFKTNFPEGGVEGMLQRLTQADSLAETRELQIQRITALRTKERDGFRDQIAALQKEKEDLVRETQKINALQTEIRTRDAKTQTLEKQLSDTQHALTLSQEQAEGYRAQLTSEQTSAQTARLSHEEEIKTVRRTYDQNIETLREDNRKLRDEIATLQRNIDDYKYANELAVQARDQLQQNNYELALQNVDAGLGRATDHALLLSMQETIQEILDDPLEQALRREETRNRIQQLQEKRKELASRLLKDANTSLSNGQLDESVELAEQVIKLLPDDERSKADAQKVIDRTEEQKTKLRLILLEAKQSITDNDLNGAKKKLQQAVKISSSHPEVKALEAQLSENQES
ncbi:MAG: tetratricopeptide repeat protein [Candidatus Hinthialibacter antarcticus]|nr:tetratricopeptide repeat protein [Candidatus Hinthialibacter antarcticus]